MLERHRLRILGVDLHDVAEPVGLVPVVGTARVEPGLVLFPTHGGGLVRQPVAALLLGGTRGPEEAVEVLLAREDGSPGRGAAGAVAEGAADPAALGVLLGADQVGAGERTGQLEAGIHGDAPVQPRPAHILPGLALAAAPKLHHGHSDGVAEDGPPFPRFGVRSRSGRKHDLRIHVLVIAHEQRLPAARAAEDVEVVVVVAELLRLGCGALGGEVELRGPGEQRVAPADHGVPVVARGHIERVGGRGDRRDGCEAKATVRGAVAAGSALAGTGGGNGGLRSAGQDHGGAEHTRRSGSEGGPAGELRGGDVPKIAVRGGVADLLGAGVVAFEPAGHGAALAPGVRPGQQVQQGLHGQVLPSRETAGRTQRVRDRLPAAGWQVNGE